MTFYRIAPEVIKKRDLRFPNDNRKDKRRFKKKQERTMKRKRGKKEE